MTGAHSEAAWSNAIACVLPSGFIEDLARAVTNTGERDAGARWLLSFVADYLRKQGCPDAPLNAFDFAWIDIEALGRLWPAIRLSASNWPEPEPVTANLARFLVERMPAIWNGPSWRWHVPVTRTLVIADRLDTLVSMFSAGLQPNGSKDPYALRRAARHLLMQTMFPITRGISA